MDADSEATNSQIENLLRVIDQAYWMVEQGDRIGALRILAQYAKFKEQTDHWITKK